MEQTNFDQMIQKQQLNLIKLQNCLHEMKKEYMMYQQMINQLKNQISKKNDVQK